MSTAQLELGVDDGLMSLRTAWAVVGPAVSTSTGDRRLPDVQPVSFDGTVAVIGTPSKFARDWVERRLASTLRAALAEHMGVPKLQLTVVVDGRTRLPLPPPPFPEERGSQKDGAKRPPVIQAEMISSRVDSRRTFETFVVGKSNRLAHGACIAVASTPGSTYNPLFLYGMPGLGKTHLMHAIGNELQSAHPDMVVACVGADEFTNRFVGALRDRRTDDFRRAYRAVDVWLIDDIQMIASREQTKGEFFQTFNALLEMGKQVVIASDRAPRDLRLMDDRLRSRFESGLIVDLLPPDVQTAKAILMAKAERENVVLPPDIAEYVATRVRPDIRALEGSLVKLIACASVTKLPITKGLADEVLGDYYGDRPDTCVRQVSTAQIVQLVADDLRVDAAQIVAGGSRRKDLTFARQAAMYLCKEVGREATSLVASTFGCSSHSAVTHAHARMARAMATDPSLYGRIVKIRGAL